MIDEVHCIRTKAIKEVVAREGGFVDHVNDSGGATRWGITEAVARKHGYNGSMTSLPEWKAFEVYDFAYWQPLKLDQIALISDELAAYLFDYGVNSGLKRSAKTLQRVLNVLNRGGKDYSDLKEDGLIGSKTIEAITALINSRGDDGIKVLTEAINAMRISFLINLSERKESQESFTFGWLKRVVELKGAA